MQSKLLLIAAMVVFATPLPGVCASITAVCGQIRGHTVGYHDGKRVDEPDGFVDSVFSYSIPNVAMGEPALIITQSSKVAGVTPASERGVVVNVGRNLVSVLVLFDNATWLHTLMPEAGKAIIVKVSNGYLFDSGAAGYVFAADCKIGNK